MLKSLLYLSSFFLDIYASVLFDGRLGANYTVSDLEASTGPYLSSVKGSENAAHYTNVSSGLGTPLWGAVDRPILITIDNSSVFIPGGSTPQLGFRRTDLIAQSPTSGANRTEFDDDVLEAGDTTFHFSVLGDLDNPLNLAHEYQVAWIEPDDGSHVFDLQIGTPFNTTTTPESQDLKVRSKNGTVIFSTPFTAKIWHNFAVTVNWEALTLEALYSIEDAELQRVTAVTTNDGAVSGPTGQGDFHIAVLKLPLINPADTPTEQADVAHFGIQEGTKEGLFFSGVFVERA